VERFEEAFDRLLRVGYKVAYRILGDGQAAQDIAQESLARAYVHWNKVSEYADAWCARVAGNLALDAVRRQQRHSNERSDEPTARDDMSDERLDLQRALRRLPRRQHQVVLLRYVADLPETEVAAALQCSVGTVKTHASRGLAVLRRQLEAAPYAATSDVGQG